MKKKQITDFMASLHEAFTPRKTPPAAVQRWLWRFFFGGLVLLAVLFTLAAYGLLGPMPGFERLENPNSNLATEIISADGKTLGTFYLDENRSPVRYEDLPQEMVDALIATEDSRFFDHSGVDAIGTLRAVVFLGARGGASTITQQLSKLLFTEKVARSKPGRILQKFKEWVIAVRLERQYTKEEIIAMYLNTYDFGNNADGIRSAALTYFGKEPKDLLVQESAMLIGMLKNSSLYNPRPNRNPEGTLRRRNVVLDQMEKYGFIEDDALDSLQQIPLNLNYNPQSHQSGLATYFRMHLRDFLKDWIEKNPKEDGSKYNLYLDGLRVYTTIDSRMQEHAEESVTEHLKNVQATFNMQNTREKNKTAPFSGVSAEEINRIVQTAIRRSERWFAMKAEGKSESDILASFDQPKAMRVFNWKSPEYERDTVMTPKDSIIYYKYFMRAAMMSMEPQTGHIKAWVGGINYRHFQYDNVFQGSRQAGSVFKPFVYAAAIDQLRLSPCDVRPDTQYCIAPGKHNNIEAWCPRNSGEEFTGEMMTLRTALARSVNSITAQVIDQVGPEPVVQLVKNLGIRNTIPPVPSIALGTADINVMEMVGAYSAFANKGVYVKPVAITHITDKNGRVLYQYTPETRDVLSEDVAYAVVNLLEGVTQGGSGARLRTEGAETYRVDYQEMATGYPWKFTNPIAGKTGTTQNQSDGWFMGMVPNLVTGVWVGAEDRATHFRSITYGQGAALALPIWANYMRRNYNVPELGVSSGAFHRPAVMSIEVDCRKQAAAEAVLVDEDDDLEEF